MKHHGGDLPPDYWEPIRSDESPKEALRKEGSMTYTLVSPVNDPYVLESSLLKSPDVDSRFEVILQRGYPSAASAYNQALECATSEVVIFAHQDVFLPPGWVGCFEAGVRKLEATDSQWGVLGVYGVRKNGTRCGWLYSTGLDCGLGAPFETPEKVSTLDEVLLAIRKSSGVRFDENLIGYHMYGTDVCLEAEKRGLRNYVLPCFLVHNSNGIGNLPISFWRAYFHIRRKWRERLPVYSPCATVTVSPFSPVKQILWRFLHFSAYRRRPGRRVPDPSVLFQRLYAAGALSRV